MVRLTFLFLACAICGAVASLEGDVKDLGSGRFEEHEEPLDRDYVNPRVSTNRDATCDGIYCDHGIDCRKYQPDLRLEIFYPFCYNPTYVQKFMPGCPTTECRFGLCEADRCVCLPGYHGDDCGDPSTPCASSPCRHPTVCLTLSGGRYKCIYKTPSPAEDLGFELLQPVQSPTLPRDFSVCDDIDCGGAAVCDVYLYKGVSLPLCYNKDNFLQDVTGCPEGVCGKGVCRNNKCICPPNHHGNNCETEGTQCLQVVCTNGGTCVTISGGGHYCHRRAPSTTLPADACSNNLCNPDDSADCSCHPSCRHERGYYCLSLAGYIGSRCHIAPPQIYCNDDAIRIEVDAAFFNEYAGTSTTAIMYVSSSLDGSGATDSSCKAVRIGDLYVLTVPTYTSACGNVVESGEGKNIIYKNKIWINNKIDSFLDIPKPVLDFACSYQKEYTVITSLQPVVDKPSSSLSGVMKGQISMDLCKISTCTDNCPARLVVKSGDMYTVGEKIHFNVAVSTPDTNEAASGLEALLTDAYLSCSAFRTTSNRAVLKDGCDNGASLSSTYSRRDERSACMSFRVPRMFGCNEFYIHVRMVLCSMQYIETLGCSEGRSYQMCTTGIQKRSTLQEDPSYYVKGPFVIATARNGVSSITFNSDAGEALVLAPERSRNRTSPDVKPMEMPSTTGGHVWMAATVGVFILAIAILLVSILFFHRRRSVNLKVATTA